VSIRGESVGGVAIAAGAPEKAEACLAWVARDEGDPQVFLTRVGADGKKQAQQMLTRAKGDASDTAIAWAGDGWIVGWVDGRDGNAEVYVTKVSRDLRRATPEIRLTSAPGDASDVRLLVDGDDVVVAWADARGSDALADVFTARLAKGDLARRGAETRVSNTASHSRSPRLARLDGSVVLGWIEEPARASERRENAAFGAMLVRLDAGGPAGAPAVVPLDGAAGSLALACDAVCHGAVSTAVENGMRLDAFGWGGGAPSPAVPLATLTGSAAEDVSPVLVGGSLFFADDNLGGQGLVREVRVAWE
jgi:hypothetical protein